MDPTAVLPPNCSEDDDAPKICAVCGDTARTSFLWYWKPGKCIATVSHWLCMRCERLSTHWSTLRSEPVMQHHTNALNEDQKKRMDAVYTAKQALYRQNSY
jgi:hypothetical protein